MMHRISADFTWTTRQALSLRFDLTCSFKRRVAYLKTMALMSPPTFTGSMAIQGTKLRKMWLPSVLLAKGWEKATSSSSNASSNSLSPSFFMYSKEAAAVTRSECLDNDYSQADHPSLPDDTPDEESVVADWAALGHLGHPEVEVHPVTEQVQTVTLRCDMSGAILHQTLYISQSVSRSGNALF